MPRPRAVITGGGGFVGSHLCDRFLTEGWEVICVDNFSTSSIHNLDHLRGEPRFHLVHADVCDGLDVTGPVRAVLHLASPASPTDYQRLAVETLKAGSLGTLHALQLARQNRARFLLASTSEVYGQPAVHPQPETYFGNVNPVGPRAMYDEAKRFAEALTTTHRTHHGVDTTIARIFNTHGPRMRSDDGRVVPTLIRQALHGRPLTVTGDGSQTRCLQYVDDLVEGLWRLHLHTHPGPVNLGSTHETTIRDLATMILDITGSASPTVYTPRPPDDPDRRRPDTALAEHVLQWKPTTDLPTGLHRTITDLTAATCTDSRP